MNPRACTMASLVEAHRDGRLGEQEVASIKRHLGACAACAKLDEDLAAIEELVRRPLPETTPLTRQRGRVRLLREAAAPRNTARARVWPIAAALAAGAALTGAWVASGGSSPEVARVARLPETLTSLVTPRSFVWAEDAARFERKTEGGVETLALVSGAVDLWVRHRKAGERFLVKTSDAEVEVRGTAFRAEAEEDLLRSVHVTEGKVEVRRRDRTEMVAAGGLWIPPELEETAGAAEADKPSAGLAPSPVPPPRSAVASVSSVPSGAPAQVDGDDASSRFAEAVRLTERGDYGAAAERLRAFRSEHQADPRAEDAAFLEIIALQKAGREADAAEAARAYLKRYPEGHRRAESQAIAER